VSLTGLQWSDVLPYLACACNLQLAPGPGVLPVVGRTEFEQSRASESMAASIVGRKDLAGGVAMTGPWQQMSADFHLPKWLALRIVLNRPAPRP
jgi:hypothetical protein